MCNITVSIMTECPFCGVSDIITVPYNDYQTWKKGVPIQRAFPNLDEITREKLISGTCNECWEKYMVCDIETDVT